MIEAFSSWDNFRHSKIRYLIWPVRSYELTKFLPIAFLMFFILLNQNVVRTTKDSYIVIYMGTQVISFIKLWGELPMGLLFVVLYTKLCNVMTTEQVFRIVVGFFLLFFAVFAFVIFPNKEFFHPNPELVEHYVQNFPYLKWFFIMWGKWSFVLFYIMGELWPVIVLSLLFWQLANKITKTEEATRFYVFFGIFGQFNLIVSKPIITYFKGQQHFLMPFLQGVSDSSEITLKSLSALVLISGVICLFLHRIIEVINIESIKNIKFKEKRADILQLNIMESTKMVLSSKYLAIICILMISYSTTVNLIEGLWFSRVKALYSTPEEFIEYQTTVYLWLGWCTIGFIFIGNFIIRKFGWFWGAVITPAMILIAGSIFFTTVLLQDQVSMLLIGIKGLSPLLIITFVGGLQNVLGKGAKYSLFDATKEMVYIPLDKEMKTKGKAAVDVIGTKIGKSAGAAVQMITFTIFPMATHEDIAGFLFSVFVVICLIWVFGVRSLSGNYQKVLKNAENIKTRPENAAT